ncbi:MAG: SprB repeat-containing protein [Saprospiraceae bacterium]
MITVTVTDDNGCTGEQTVTVNEYICPTITISETITNTSCNASCDGSIMVTPSGGTAPYTYLWSNGQTTQTATVLCAGSYSITATDSKNCTVSGSYTVTEPTQLLANATSTDETGNGFNDGTATCAPSGGTGTYIFVWSTGATTQSIQNLAPGSYTVTVTDENDCTSVETVTVAQFICPTLEIVFNTFDPTCYGNCDGDIVISSVTNGVAPYAYLWSTGETTSEIDQLCEGTYGVTITDSKNCTVSDNAELIQPDELFANASSTDETGNNLNDGTATANPSGGTIPYSYEWSNGLTTQTITGLAPGNYTVTVTDDNGCESVETITVEEFICPILSYTFTQIDNSCFESCDGEISITGITNGTPPYTYSWGDGQSGQTATGLCIGGYSVTIVDDNNCTLESDVFEITEPDEIILDITTTDESYYQGGDGTAIVVASGGVLGYTYLWSNGEQSNAINELTPENIQ